MERSPSRSTMVSRASGANLDLDRRPSMSRNSSRRDSTGSALQSRNSFLQSGLSRAGSSASVMQKQQQQADLRKAGEELRNALVAANGDTSSTHRFAGTQILKLCRKNEYHAMLLKGGLAPAMVKLIATNDLKTVQPTASAYALLCGNGFERKQIVQYNSMSALNGCVRLKDDTVRTAVSNIYAYALTDPKCVAMFVKNKGMDIMPTLCSSNLGVAGVAKLLGALATQQQTATLMGEMNFLVKFVDVCVTDNVKVATACSKALALLLRHEPLREQLAQSNIYKLLLSYLQAFSDDQPKNIVISQTLSCLEQLTEPAAYATKFGGADATALMAVIDRCWNIGLCTLALTLLRNMARGSGIVRNLLTETFEFSEREPQEDFGYAQDDQSAVGADDQMSEMWRPDSRMDFETASMMSGSFRADSVMGLRSESRLSAANFPPRSESRLSSGDHSRSPSRADSSQMNSRSESRMSSAETSRSPSQMSSRPLALQTAQSQAAMHMGPMSPRDRAMSVMSPTTTANRHNELMEEPSRSRRHSVAVGAVTGIPSLQVTQVSGAQTRAGSPTPSLGDSIVSVDSHDSTPATPLQGPADAEQGEVAVTSASTPAESVPVPTPRTAHRTSWMPAGRKTRFNYMRMLLGPRFEELHCEQLVAEIIAGIALDTTGAYGLADINVVQLLMTWMLSPDATLASNALGAVRNWGKHEPGAKAIVYNDGLNLVMKVMNTSSVDAVRLMALDALGALLPLAKAKLAPESIQAVIDLCYHPVISARVQAAQAIASMCKIAANRAIIVERNGIEAILDTVRKSRVLEPDMCMIVAQILGDIAVDDETGHEIVQRNGLCVLLLMLQSPSLEAQTKATAAVCIIARNSNSMKAAITQSTVMGSLVTLARAHSVDIRRAAMQALNQLTSAESAREVFVEKMGHMLLVVVLETEDDNEVLAQCLQATLNLGCDTKHQQALVNAGVLKRLASMVRHQTEPKVLMLVLMTLRPFALGEQYLDALMQLEIHTMAIGISAEHDIAEVSQAAAALLCNFCSHEKTHVSIREAKGVVSLVHAAQAGGMIAAMCARALSRFATTSTVADEVVRAGAAEVFAQIGADPSTPQAQEDALGLIEHLCSLSLNCKDEFLSHSSAKTLISQLASPTAHPASCEGVLNYLSTYVQFQRHAGLDILLSGDTLPHLKRLLQSDFMRVRDAVARLLVHVACYVKTHNVLQDCGILAVLEKMTTSDKNPAARTARTVLKTCAVSTH